MCVCVCVCVFSLIQIFFLKIYLMHIVVQLLSHVCHINLAQLHGLCDRIKL